MLESNRWMVDDAEFLLAIYDGGAKDGTAYTMNYARYKKQDIMSIHPDTLTMIDGLKLAVLERRRQMNSHFLYLKYFDYSKVLRRETHFRISIPLSRVRFPKSHTYLLHSGNFH